MANKVLVGSLAACGLAIGASAAVLNTAPAKVATTTPPKATTTVAAKTTTTQPLIGMSSTWPLTTAVATTAPAGTQTAAAVAATPVLRKLPPLDLTGFRLWNWSAKWIGAEWSNVDSPLSWKFDHIRQSAGADTLMTLDAAGGPQLQAGASEARNDGLWEADVTLPQLRDGLIVAPLWIYDPTSRDEIDFELAGRRGLDVSIHVYVNGVHKTKTVRLFAGTDMSGQRKRFGIKVDQRAGYADMYVDGKQVYRWDRATSGYFVSRPLKPWIQMMGLNPTNTGYVQWAGKWMPLATGQTLTMRVHGYGYTTLAGQVVR